MLQIFSQLNTALILGVACICLGLAVHIVLSVFRVVGSLPPERTPLEA